MHALPSSPSETIISLRAIPSFPVVHYGATHQFATPTTLHLHEPNRIPSQTPSLTWSDVIGWANTPFEAASTDDQDKRSSSSLRCLGFPTSSIFLETARNTSNLLWSTLLSLVKRLFWCLPSFGNSRRCNADQRDTAPAFQTQHVTIPHRDPKQASTASVMPMCCSPEYLVACSPFFDPRAFARRDTLHQIGHLLVCAILHGGVDHGFDVLRLCVVKEGSITDDEASTLPDGIDEVLGILLHFLRRAQIQHGRG